MQDAPWSCCVMTTTDHKDIDIDHVVDLTGCRTEADAPGATFQYLNPLVSNLYASIDYFS